MGVFKPTILRLASAEFTRPADATQYAVGDVVGPATTPAVQTLLKAGSYSSSGGELGAIRLSKSANAVTTATFRIYIYNTAPTPIADNSAWTLLYADRDKLVGYRDLDIMVAGATGGAVGQTPATTTPLIYTTAPGSSGSLYAVIVALGTYTPTSGETFSLSVTVNQYR